MNDLCAELIDFAHQLGLSLLSLSLNLTASLLSRAIGVCLGGCDRLAVKVVDLLLSLENRCLSRLASSLELFSEFSL